MNLSAWSIRHPVFVYLLFFVLAVSGAAGFWKMKVQNFPDIIIPTVSISVALPGAPAEIVETEVTRKVEDALASLSEVDQISSTVSEGVSSTLLSFKLEKNADQALNEVRDILGQIRATLPADIKDPVITQIKTGSSAVVTYAVASTSKDMIDLSSYVDNELARQLASVPGLSRIVRQGGISRQAEVKLDPQMLAQHGLTALEVSRQLYQNQKDLPSGQSSVDGKQSSYRTSNAVRSFKELEEYSVTSPAGVAVPLSELGRITDSQESGKQVALLDGKPVVAFQAYKNEGASEVALEEELGIVLAKIAQENPGLSFSKITDNSVRVKLNYGASMSGLLEGAVLAVLVVFLFLRNTRATLISATALPLSILPAFAAMYVFGYSLNGITLLALTLVTGILVDDAIVEIENIVRHMQMGKSPLQAAIDATTEIGVAVIATTLTLVAVFLPTAFMPGIPGLFFKQFGWTASLAVLASLLVARMLTPVMAAFLLKDHQMGSHAEPANALHQGGWVGQYLRSASWCLRNPGKTVSFAIAFFVGSLAVAAKLPSGFLPAPVSDTLGITLESAPGTGYKESLELAERARSKIAHLPGVASVFTTMGNLGAGSSPFGSGAGSFNENQVSLIVQFSEKSPKPLASYQTAVRNALESEFAGIRLYFSQTGSGQKFTLTLVSTSAEKLERAANQIASDIRASLPDLPRVSSSASVTKPELVIEPDKAKLAYLGISPSYLSQLLRVSSAGDFDVVLSKLSLDDIQVPILVSIDPLRMANLDQIRALRIPTKFGPVQLGEVAQVRYTSGPSQINRFDRNRNITLSIDLQGRALGEVTSKVYGLDSVKRLPDGVSLSESGDSRGMRDLFEGFGLAMLAGLFCIYAVLVVLFNAFKHPLTILFAIPLAAAGAFVTLFVFNFSFSMPALIGLLMLMGIVTKNSILLVDFAVEKRKEGMDALNAALQACATRARPVVMTTIAMAAGMLPLALGLSGDPSFRVPMAITVIGGLLTSTVLSLVVIPVLYVLLENFSFRKNASR